MFLVNSFQYFEARSLHVLMSLKYEVFSKTSERIPSVVLRSYSSEHVRL